MARYLSAAWFEELRAADEVVARRPGEVVLRQVVTGAPDGDVGYRVVVGDGAARLVAGQGDEADVTFTSDYPTAVAVARGELSVQAALGAGRIRVGGDLTKLAELTGPLDPLPDTIRRTTTFDDPGEPQP